MPKNCSADVEAVITHVDTVLTTGSKSQISQLKDLFGLSALTHVDDVASACKHLPPTWHQSLTPPLHAVRNNLWDWQSLSPSTGPNGTFYQFCDALEVKNGISASASGWGVDHSLNAWAKFWNNGYLKNRMLLLSYSEAVS